MRDIPPMFPSPSLLARIFGTGVHPPFGGNRVRRLCSPRHGRAIAVAVGVVEPQSEKRDASSARCSRARTRAREHDTRFVHAHGTKLGSCVSFLPHCSFVRTFVPQLVTREDSFDSRSSLDTAESDDSKLGSFPPWRRTRRTILGDPSRRARFFTVFEFRFQ